MIAGVSSVTLSVVVKRALRQVFDRPEPLGYLLPIRPTASGVWVPTPLRIIEAACDQLVDIGMLGDGAPAGPLIDAGTGDGRVLALATQFDAEREMFGIERDPALCARAVENLETLEKRRFIDPKMVKIHQGDYCSPSAYSGLGIDRQAIHLVLNYPDGNQDRLAQFIKRETGRHTTLCLLTHDLTLTVETLRLLAQHPVSATGVESVWRLSIYGKA